MPDNNPGTEINGMDALSLTAGVSAPGRSLAHRRGTSGAHSGRVCCRGLVVQRLQRRIQTKFGVNLRAPAIETIGGEIFLLILVDGQTDKHVLVGNLRF